MGFMKPTSGVLYRGFLVGCAWVTSSWKLKRGCWHRLVLRDQFTGLSPSRKIVKEPSLASRSFLGLYSVHRGKLVCGNPQNPEEGCLHSFVLLPGDAVDGSFTASPRQWEIKGSRDCAWQESVWCVPRDSVYGAMRLPEPRAATAEQNQTPKPQNETLDVVCKG